MNEERLLIFAKQISIFHKALISEGVTESSANVITSSYVAFCLDLLAKEKGKCA